MKSIATFCFFLFAIPIFSQIEAEVSLQNVSTNGSYVEFDIYLKTTSASFSHLYLGESEFVLTFNNTNFSNPSLSLSSSNTNDFSPSLFSVNNVFATRTEYFNNTSPYFIAPNSNEIIISLKGPSPKVATFNSNVARIDNVANEHRLGTFRLNGYISGEIDLEWKMDGGEQRTRILSFDNFYPFLQNEISVIGKNPFPAPDCPHDLSAEVPAILTVLNSTCGAGQTTPTGGSLSPTNGTCPIGTKPEYSENGGLSWKNLVPIYNQTNPMSILTRCQCNEDQSLKSDISITLTQPEICTPIIDCTSTVSEVNGEIYLENLKDNPNVRIFDANWSAVVFQCNPWNGSPCNETQIVNGLSQGKYFVRIVTEGSSSCDITQQITIEANNNPCLNQGGDTDNDGVCDETDNCPSTFNPGQVDGNGNGIGDICETGIPNCNLPTNLALFKPTNQSSTTTSSGIVGSASKAVDGNLNGIFFANNPSVALSIWEKQPWWEVDLGAEYLIEDINFFNRIDGSNVSRNCVVMVSSTPFISDDLDQSKAASNFHEIINGKVGTPSILSPNITGRYVRVQKESYGFLAISEIEVMGCTPSAQTFGQPDLLLFSALKDEESSQIDWIMSHDEDIEYFELERSKNGFDFNFLEKTISKNNPSLSGYEFKDQQPYYGENFYRLKIKRMDGSYYYSDIKRVQFHIDFNQIIIYPNPTNSYLNITLKDFSGEKGNIQIYNTLGQLQYERDYSSIPFIPMIVDVRNFTPGIYTVSVKINNKKQFSKQFVIIDN